MKLTVTVCNECKDPNRPVGQYTIISDQQKVTGDLCEEHAEPLQKLMRLFAAKTTARVSKAAAAPSTAKARRKPGRSIKVVDPAAIPRKE